MPRRLLVFGEKTFRITVPDDAKTTFGPWSPPKENRAYGQDTSRSGTLRVYKGAKSTENIIGVFSGITSFRDESLEYEEEVAREIGSVIWSNDKNEYKHEVKVNRSAEWVSGTPVLEDKSNGNEEAEKDDSPF